MTRRTLLQSLPMLGAPAFDPRRRFLLGLYSLPKRPDAMRQARQAGFRVVNLAPAAEDFSRARENGMYGWISAGSDPARIRKLVSGWKDNPTLLFWETEDEPSYQWKKPGPRIPPQTIRSAYRLIHALDPGRPVYLNHAPTNLVSTLKQYNPGGDIIATDIYPVIPHGIRELYALWPDGRQGDLLNTHISQVGQYADKMRQVAGPGRAVFMVLQAFAWEDLREKDRDPRMVLYPTRDQLRFMAWQSIVHGVNGLLFWGAHSIPGRAAIWDDLLSVAREIDSLLEPLSAPPLSLPIQCRYHDTGHSLDRGIEWVAKTEKGGVLVFAVNADCNPVDVTMEGLPGARTCEVLFESRNLPVTGASVRDQFAPFGVHLYRLRR